MAVEVPEEAIEKAARASFYLLKGPHEAAVKFEDLPQSAIDGWLASAREGLAAAAPMIEAAALNQEADRIHSTIQAFGYGPNDDPPPGSIAGALCNVAVEMRERAAVVLRGEGDPK